MDMDFVEYIESLDYNTMESAKAGLINMYIKWYLSCHTDSVMTPGEQFFIVLKNKVSDQAIIDYVADSYMPILNLHSRLMKRLQPIRIK